MKIIAMDDERLALSGLVTSIRKVVPEAEIQGFMDGESAFRYAEEKKPEVAFLDIEMRMESGMEVARKLVEINPDINIIFQTGYKQYMEDAFGIHASGYILKPVTTEKIRRELSNLRRPVEEKEKRRVRVRTFGDFEVFVDDVPLTFLYARSKELLAVLVDNKGAMCTKGKLMDVLWEDEEEIAKHASYMSNLVSDLGRVFGEKNCEDVLIRRRGQLGINRNLIECDYYDWLEGDPEARASFRGEYMSQYSWAEVTLAGMV